MRNINDILQHARAELRTLRDDELDAVSGGTSKVQKKGDETDANMIRNIAG